MGGDAAPAGTEAAAQRVLPVVVSIALLAGVVGALAQIELERVDGLTIFLVAAGLASGVVAVRSVGPLGVTPTFVASLLAAGFLGPLTAALLSVPAELVAARRVHTARWPAASNIAATIIPAVIAADMVRLIAPANERAAGFYVVLAAAGFVMLGLNFALVAFFVWLGGRPGMSMSLFWEYMPTQALNIALAVAGAAIYVRVGLPGIAFALAALVTFAYMAQLLERARAQAKLAEERADQNLTLSYGVLSGLILALDKRDSRAARHAVAVARFGRDIAAAAGLSEREQDLVHTAGLLHDIGQFAFNDRLYEPGYQLRDEDVERIQGHPEVGEELLKNLVGYGPVAEIVRSHHERVDGIGYPDALMADEIPVLSRIIAVAEVYDTLTSPDTYRPVTMSPLQALNELHRVAGTQLDGRFVDALSRALGDKAFDDHVVKTADFDAELDLERRIREARRQAS